MFVAAVCGGGTKRDFEVFLSALIAWTMMLFQYVQIGGSVE